MGMTSWQCTLLGVWGVSGYSIRHNAIKLTAPPPQCTLSSATSKFAHCNHATQFGTNWLILQICSNVPRQECSQVPRQQCESVARRVPSERCFQIPREQCQQVQRHHHHHYHYHYHHYHYVSRSRDRCPRSSVATCLGSSVRPCLDRSARMCPDSSAGDIQY